MSSLNEFPAGESKFDDTIIEGLPNFFLGGCQKTASTWLHTCFREHPDLFVPEQDATHYFTINYFRGLEWYRQFYINYSGEKMVGDTTPSYIRDYHVPLRISEYNPNSKLIFTFRNPIDRAFSHYWHEKKKRKIAFDFSEVLENYDLYENWIVAGFYYQHLSRFYQYFNKDQILVLIYDDLQKDPFYFLKKIFHFLEVDDVFTPSVIEKKLNVAWHHPGERLASSPTKFAKLINKLMPPLLSHRIRQRIVRVMDKIYRPNASPSEYYDIGVSPKIRSKLREIYSSENQNLAQIIGRDLSHWT